MNESLLSHPVAGGLIAGGETENTAIWNDPLYGFRCKCRPDKGFKDIGVLVDLKSAKDASPFEFSKDAANFGYHVQAAWYTDGMNSVQNEVKYRDFSLCCL